MRGEPTRCDDCQRMNWMKDLETLEYGVETLLLCPECLEAARDNLDIIRHDDEQYRNRHE